MPEDLEKAQVMFKLTRKGNWNACYDRLEHFKRFKNLDLIIKDLVKIRWVILHKNQLINNNANSQYKRNN